MKKILSALLNKTTNGLHETALLLGAFTLLSQLLALVRDRLFAGSFGASETLDIYYAAFRIPDFVYVTVASMVSVAVLVPFLTNKISSNSKDGQRFFETVFRSFFFFISLVSLALFFLIPSLSEIIFPGITGSSRTELISLTRLLLFSPVLLGLSNLFASVTQVYKKFLVYAISPVLYNVGIIFGVVFLYPAFGILGLGWGVVLGAFLHLIIQLPVLLKQGFIPHLGWKVSLAEIRTVVLTSLPRTLTLSAHQLAFLFLISIASLMREGSITIFNLAHNLQTVPLTIIGMSYSVAAFPALAHFFAKGKMKEFVENVSIAARHIIFWSLPTIALFIVLRAQVVRTILGTGEFSWADTRLTAAVLALFALSVTAQALNLIFVRGYYAAGRTFRPLIVNGISSLLIIVLSYVFVFLFAHHDWFRTTLETLLRIEDIPGSTVVVLALAFSVGVIINSALLWLSFSRDFKDFNLSAGRTLFESSLASIALALASYIGLWLFVRLFDIQTTIGIFMQGLCAGLTGIVFYALILTLLGNREIKEISRYLRKGLRRKVSRLRGLQNNL